MVCQPGDIDQYAKALRRLIFDVGLRREMGEVAWQIGQRSAGMGRPGAELHEGDWLNASVDHRLCFGRFPVA